MLTIENLEVSYGRAQVLWGVSLNINEGEIIALVGANGAGKTTLLKTISGIVKKRSGTISYDGKPFDKLSARDIVKMGIVQVPEGRKLFPEMNILENLMMGAYKVPGEEREKRLDQVFTLFPVLKERMKQLAGTLSGGEQQMVALARGLMAGPRLLMLDEPSLGLAPLVVERIFEAVLKIHREGVTVLLVEQNVHEALELADRGYVLENGKIALEGAGSELLGNEHVRCAYLGI
ncbi:MAG: High-affinity branched-chain amino acid transport ATP-binding protein LivF [Syntrophorhabdus sp. PtaB.Bin047]|nr:MAG: High-affinity branched-chain amino acid transport ATP-binding protein LivF [Syntrophorhabdus sp. PtaB.Bin047]